MTSLAETPFGAASVRVFIHSEEWSKGTLNFQHWLRGTCCAISLWAGLYISPSPYYLEMLT